MTLIPLARAISAMAARLFPIASVGTGPRSSICPVTCPPMPRFQIRLARKGLAEALHIVQIVGDGVAHQDNSLFPGGGWLDGGILGRVAPRVTKIVNQAGWALEVEPTQRAVLILLCYKLSSPLKI